MLLEILEAFWRQGNYLWVDLELKWTQNFEKERYYILLDIYAYSYLLLEYE